MWRQELDNPIITKSLEHFAVWHLLLLLATAKPRRVLFKGKERVLEPGQLVTTRKELTKMIKSLNEPKVKRVLEEFENNGQIIQECSNKNRIITLVNWGKYQKTGQQNIPETSHKTVISDNRKDEIGQQLDNNWTTTGQRAF